MSDRIKELEAEVARLRDWKRLMEEAPGEAKEIIRQRMLESDAIEPIVKAWKEANEYLIECIDDLIQHIGLLISVIEGEEAGLQYRRTISNATAAVQKAKEVSRFDARHSRV